MNLLEQILQDKRDEVGAAKAARPLGDLQKKIHDISKPLGFRQAGAEPPVQGPAPVKAPAEAVESTRPSLKSMQSPDSAGWVVASALLFR